MALLIVIASLTLGAQSNAPKITAYVTDREESEVFATVLGKTLSPAELAGLGWLRVPGDKVNLVITRDTWTPNSYALLGVMLRFLGSVRDFNNLMVRDFPAECQQFLLRRTNIGATTNEGRPPQIDLSSSVEFKFVLNAKLQAGGTAQRVLLSLPLARKTFPKAADLKWSIDSPVRDATPRLRTAYQVRFDRPLAEYTFLIQNEEVASMLRRRREELEAEVQNGIRALTARLYPELAEFRSELLVGPIAQAPSPWRDLLEKWTEGVLHSTPTGQGGYRVTEASGQLELLFRRTENERASVPLRSIFDRP